MPTLITDACTNCGACVQSCPNGGISEGQYKVELDATLCTECVGFFASEQCVVACPVDACVPDPNNVETEAVLFERARRIHADSPRQPTLSPETSHFRAVEAPRVRWWKRLVPLLGDSHQDVPDLEDAPPAR